MKFSILRWVITAALAASALAAVTQPAASQANRAGTVPHELTVSSENEGAAVDLQSGDELVVRLQSNPSTGYAWSVASLDTQALTPLATAEYEGSPQLLGAPVTQVLRFAPRSAGTSNLSLVYRRPWETLLSASAQSSYTLQVTTHGSASYSYTPSASTTAANLPQEADASQAGQYFSDVFRSLFTGAVSSLPAYKNWCDEGDCTPIRDQGSCGSCWAFSVVGALESAILKTDGVSRDLSEQYLVSCNGYGYSCAGGSYPAHYYHQNAIPSGESSAGAVYETNFPYTATDSSCNTTLQPHAHHERINSWSYVSYSTPTTAQIKQAILDHGPISASICAGNNFQNYKGGVLSASDNTCSYGTNHAIVLVGWDDSKGTSGAWRLRNSWGTHWGESGYMWIAYGVSAVGSDANYVVYQGGTANPTATPTKAPTQTPTPVPTATPPQDFKYHLFLPSAQN
jgi:inhibitor of cysteine peptidase